MREYHWLVCGLLASMLLHATEAQADDSHEILVKQGHFWLERDDGKRAAEVWNKLFLISPDHPEALYGLATIELKAGRIEPARDYLRRLEQAHSGHPLVAQLEQDLLLSSERNKALLAQARQAVAESDVDEAAKKYRDALGDRLPVGEVGRDYYHRLGYTEGGLLEAIDGLRRLEAQTPRDPLLQLALARHLARNEPTRLEAIGRLARLSTNYDVGSEATESWRDALLWLGKPTAEHRPLYATYVELYPHDEEIRALLQRASQAGTQAAGAPPKPDPLRLRTDAAMKLIESGNPARARVEFQAVLAQRPNDSEALGGMGVLSMREGNWGQAHDYLVRARRGNAAWQSSLSIAQYWVDVERARGLVQQGKIAEARTLADSLVKRNSNEAAAKDLLAEILVAQGEAKGAIAIYREALGRRPDDAELRFRLARLYQQEGRDAEARAMLDELLRQHPYDPEVLYANAALAADAGNWEAVRDGLAQIPLDQRTPPMRHLRATADLRLRLAEAQTLARAGKKAEALQLLGDVRAEAGSNFDVLNAVAEAYVDMGAAARGLALLGPLRTQGHERGTGASIAYVGLLLESGQDVEAAVILRHLEQQNLTDAQRARVDALSDVHIVRRANSLMERGEAAAAQDALARVLAKRPDDPEALNSLARSYTLAGQASRALEIYESLRQSHPDNARIRMGLAEAALQMGDQRRARREADTAADLAPANVDVLTRAAQVHQQLGRTADAAKLLERAARLDLRGAAPDTRNPGQK
ncbi:tetratricopeptide repeat protein [Pusillimonas sp.]|uniref:tetratricopeptide repeat protein n=2 Tax=Burkholderiales TaxID=80840 RepID=UPI0037C7305B